jgi:alkaline phosphatase D
MPIRAPEASNLLKIYRRFDFGSLMTLHMLDTRIEGRVRQYANFGDPFSTPNYTYGDYSVGLTPVNGVYPDAARTLISATQQSWLGAGMAASTATWQVLGNQDVMARMWLPANVLNAQSAATAAPTPANAQAVQQAISNYLTAKATRAQAGAAALTPTQTTLLSPAANPRLPFNLDSWDGYPLARETLLQTAKAQGKQWDGRPHL